MARSENGAIVVLEPEGVCDGPPRLPGQLPAQPAADVTRPREFVPAIRVQQVGLGDGEAVGDDEFDSVKRGHGSGCVAR